VCFCDTKRKKNEEKREREKKPVSVRV